MRPMIPTALLLLSLAPIAAHAETDEPIGPLAQSFYPSEDDDRPALFLPQEGDSDPANFQPQAGDSDPANFEPEDGDSNSDNFESPDLDELAAPTAPGERATA